MECYQTDASYFYTCQISLKKFRRTQVILFSPRDGIPRHRGIDVDRGLMIQERVCENRNSKFGMRALHPGSPDGLDLTTSLTVPIDKTGRRADAKLSPRGHHTDRRDATDFLEFMMITFSIREQQEVSWLLSSRTQDLQRGYLGRNELR